MYLVRLGCAQLPGLRAVSTSFVELAAAKSGVGSQPKLLPPEERLQYLRKAEIRVAVFAGVSLLVGYFALKKAFAVMAAKLPKTTQVAPASTSAPATTAPATTAPATTSKPLVLAGPSGAGKSTLIKKLFADHKEVFGFSVSHTTRKPRPGETNGVEYYFTTREEMKRSIDEGNFIEWAEFASNMYGTSKKAVENVLSKGQVCILDIDMQGVRNIKKSDLTPVYILIKPPSLEELEKRLRSRGTETEESLSKRLSVAKAELEYAEQAGVFDYIIVNDTVEEAYAKLKEAIESSIGIPPK